MGDISACSCPILDDVHDLPYAALFLQTCAQVLLTLDSLARSGLVRQASCSSLTLRLSALSLDQL